MDREAQIKEREKRLIRRRQQLRDNREEEEYRYARNNKGPKKTIRGDKTLGTDRLDRIRRRGKEIEKEQMMEFVQQRNELNGREDEEEIRIYREMKWKAI